MSTLGEQREDTLPSCTQSQDPLTSPQSVGKNAEICEYSFHRPAKQLVRLTSGANAYQAYATFDLTTFERFRYNFLGFRCHLFLLRQS